MNMDARHSIFQLTQDASQQSNLRDRRYSLLSGEFMVKLTCIFARLTLHGSAQFLSRCLVE